MTASGSADVVEVIQPPNLLKLKAGSGGFDPKAVLRAEARVGELAFGFTQWARDQSKELAELMAALNEAGWGESPGMEKARRIAFDLKGQSGTFGYPLASTIADNIGRLLALAYDVRVLALARAHADTLRLIYGKSVVGDGGVKGREIMATLGAAVDHFAPRMPEPPEGPPPAEAPPAAAVN
jgi:hypothetical protein